MFTIAHTALLGVGVVFLVVSALLIKLTIDDPNKELHASSTTAMYANLTATIGFAVLILPVSMGSLHIIQLHAGLSHMLVLLPVIFVSAASTAFYLMCFVDNLTQNTAP